MWVYLPPCAASANIACEASNPGLAHAILYQQRMPHRCSRLLVLRLSSTGLPTPDAPNPAPLCCPPNQVCACPSQAGLHHPGRPGHRCHRSSHARRDRCAGGLAQRGAAAVLRRRPAAGGVQSNPSPFDVHRSNHRTCVDANSPAPFPIPYPFHLPFGPLSLPGVRRPAGHQLRPGAGGGRRGAGVCTTRRRRRRDLVHGVFKRERACVAACLLRLRSTSAACACTHAYTVCAVPTAQISGSLRSQPLPLHAGERRHRALLPHRVCCQVGRQRGGHGRCAVPGGWAQGADPGSEVRRRALRHCHVWRGLWEGCQGVRQVHRQARHVA